MTPTFARDRFVPRPGIFIALCVVAIVLTRAAIIVATPRSADLPDLRIYQAAGQAVLAGVNPYDFADQPATREDLRARASTPGNPADFAETLASWNYYVSGNLPASTALYALFESAADGSRPRWRWLLILGDLAIVVGLLALLRALRVGLEAGVTQLACLSLVVFNPILIVSGSAIPEDKQFQTALLLFGAALLISANRGAGHALLTGFVLSLSVLFKFFGVFLLPLWIADARGKNLRFTAGTVLGGVVPLAISLAWFGPRFIATMGARGVSNSVEGPEHASPWVLVPLAGGEYMLVKAATMLIFCGTLVWLLVRRRIDVLNFCSGATVAFACLWLDKGAMNRMNIAIMFAIAAMASLNPRLFLAFSLGLAALSGAAYAVGVGLMDVELTRIDALLVTIFLLAYWLVLALVRGDDGSGARRRTF